MKQSMFRFHTVQMSRCFGDGKTALYRGMIDRRPIAGIRETAEDLHERGCTVSPATIEYVLQCLADQLPDLMASDGGRPRRLGSLCLFTPRIQGTFAAQDADFDPAANSVRITARVSRDFRDALRKVPAVNTTPGVTYSHVQRETSKRFWIYWNAFVDEDFELFGRHLEIADGRTDEGVWLVAADGTRIATPVSNQSWNGIDAHVPAGTKTGVYTLLIRTRGLQPETAPVYEFSHQVRVRPKGTGSASEGGIHDDTRHYVRRRVRT